MYTPNTSLMLAGSDLRLLDESEHAPRTARAKTARSSHRTATALVRLANRILSLFL